MIPEYISERGNENFSSAEAEEYLQSLNNRFARSVIPAFVFLGAILAVGCAGNLVVCYIYLLKFKRSTTRCCVLALAVFDLLSCCIGIPGDILDLTNNYTFRNVILCKVLSFCNGFSAFGSAAVLLIIAADRYRKICKPLSKQMTLHFAKIAIALGCVGSVFVSSPAFWLYGLRTVTTSNSFINGTDCSTQDHYIGTLHPLIYNCVLFLIFFISTSVLVILYVKIWRKISNQMEQRRNKKRYVVNRQREKVQYSLPNTSVMSASDFSPPATNYTDEEVHRTKLTESFISNRTLKHLTRHRLCKREQNVRKTTFMLFLITLVFVLSFLPHLVLMAARAVYQEMFDGLDSWGTAAYNLFLRSYFLNSASNPVIYGFCNLQFRLECKLLWMKLFRRQM